MGYLMIDHRGTQGIELVGGEARLTGRDGKLVEMDTVSCKHCQGCIRIVIRGCTRAYETKHSCPTCRGPICNHCARAMHVSGGVCPGPVMARIDRAIARRRAGEAVSIRPGPYPRN